jgi:uncharacterized protein
MYRKKKGTALITGASSGIGLELAKVFAREGYDLALVARRRPKLEEVKKELERDHDIQVWPLKFDLSMMGAANELSRELDQDSIVVDILVNNAGFGSYGRFQEQDELTQLQMLRLNIESLTQLTRLLLPKMVERGSGRVMNVASTGAFVPCPYMAVYCATKAYVLSLSEALGEELKGTGVTVTALCPGGTSTEFFQRAGNLNSRITKNMMEADKVAELGYLALMKGKPVAVTGIKNWLAIQAPRLFPRKLVAAFVKRLQETPRK